MTYTHCETINGGRTGVAGNFHNYFSVQCATKYIETSENRRNLKMPASAFINVTLLCFLNAFLFVAGIFLNYVVIISLWRSSQLRKKQCYFMILVLSYFDLAVVAFTHPILILSTMLWSMQVRTFDAEIEVLRLCTTIVVGSFSMSSLLTLNIERLLALACPFFHHAAVTKRRLIVVLLLIMTILVTLLPLHYFLKKTVGNMLVAVFLVPLLITFIVLNYQMYGIAKLKNADHRVAPTDDQERKIAMKKFRSVSTCSLAVACLCVCFFPGIIFSLWGATSKSPWSDAHIVLSKLWSNTFGAMNSTLNCLIFFWRNSILRREGMKVAKCLRTVRA